MQTGRQADRHAGRQAGGRVGRQAEGRQAGNAELILADRCNEINGFKSAPWEPLEALGSIDMGFRAHFGKQLHRTQLFARAEDGCRTVQNVILANSFQEINDSEGCESSGAGRVNPWIRWSRRG